MRPFGRPMNEEKMEAAKIFASRFISMTLGVETTVAKYKQKLSGDPHKETTSLSPSVFQCDLTLSMWMSGKNLKVKPDLVMLNSIGAPSGAFVTPHYALQLSDGEGNLCKQTRNVKAGEVATFSSSTLKALKEDLSVITTIKFMGLDLRDEPLVLSSQGSPKVHISDDSNEGGAER